MSRFFVALAREAFCLPLPAAAGLPLFEPSSALSATPLSASAAGLALLESAAAGCSGINTRQAALRTVILDLPFVVSLAPQTFSLLYALASDAVRGASPQDLAVLGCVLRILEVQLFYLAQTGRDSTPVLPAAGPIAAEFECARPAHLWSLDAKSWRVLLEDLVFHKKREVERALGCIVAGFDVLYAGEQASLLPRLRADIATADEATKAIKISFFTRYPARSRPSTALSQPLMST